MKGVDVEGVVVKKSDPVNRGGKLYSRAVLEDGSAQIVLNLWREQVETPAVGDPIRVTRAFVSTWQGEVQLSTWSEIVVLERGAAKAAALAGTDPNIQRNRVVQLFESLLAEGKKGGRAIVGREEIDPKTGKRRLVFMLGD